MNKQYGTYKNKSIIKLRYVIENFWTEKTEKVDIMSQKTQDMKIIIKAYEHSWRKIMKIVSCQRGRL